MTAFDLTLNTAIGEDAAADPYAHSKGFNAASFAAYNLIGDATALHYAEPDARAHHSRAVIAAMHRIADALGFVSVPKADHLALTGFIEDLRDHKPEVISGRHNGNRDPQDDVDDMMPLGEFEAFQDDAAKLIPRPAKVRSAA